MRKFWDIAFGVFVVSAFIICLLLLAALATGIIEP